MRRAAVFAVLGLAACGPISPERAADMCEERARAAQGITGEAAMGVGSDGRVITDIDVGFNLSSDYVRGRDPYAVYDSCVRQKTGQGPIRPLVL